VVSFLLVNIARLVDLELGLNEAANGLVANDSLQSQK